MVVMRIVNEDKNWMSSKTECWRDILWYYDQMMNHNRWDLMDEFTCLYLHYENDLGGTKGYNSKNDYGNHVRRLYIVCCQSFSEDDINDLKSGAKSIKDFDSNNIL